MKITIAMLLNKLRKNVDLILISLFIAIVYIGGWQTEVIGFLQRGILATGFMNAKPDNEMIVKDVDLDFYVTDLAGKKTHLELLKGKTIFINIWATWCPPCVAEMPDINALYTGLKSREDIVFLMVSVDQDQEKAKEFIIKKSLQYPVYFIHSSLPDDFKYQSIPSTFVVSPQGEIIYHKEGMASYNTEDFRNFLLNL